MNALNLTKSQFLHTSIAHNASNMDAMKYRERQTILDLLIGYTNSTFIC